MQNVNDKRTDLLPTDEELSRLRHENLGRLLDFVHVAFDRLALEYLHRAGYPYIRAAHTHMLRTMRASGASLTDMAEEAGISKQAMSKLAAEFERMGFIEWRDGPPRTIHTTAAGQTLLKYGVLALREAEDHYFSEISGEEREILRKLLLRVSEADSNGRSPTWRRRRA
ncbi:MAG: winged helix-turn-helix transcriptional regulator [Pararhodobacter sp.]|nr:winged helix-turn-helix transcriptional regulator [Pararhodobacter sp.]